MFEASINLLRLWKVISREEIGGGRFAIIDALEVALSSRG
jgi:hypothetical protein